MSAQTAEVEYMPALRFPEFEEDWEPTKIGAIGRVIRGASPRPKADPRFYGPGIPRLMVEDVARDGKIADPISDSLTLEGAKQSRFCPAGTLTVVCSGTAKTVGQPSFLKRDACIHDGFLAIVDLNEAQPPDFIYYQIQRLQEKSERLATHGGTFINLTTEILREYERAFPSLPEQKKIAAFLGAADQKIAQLKEKKTLLEAYKKGCMQQIFSQQIRFKDDDGNAFPDWESALFSELVERVKTKFNPRGASERPIVVELDNLQTGTGRIIGQHELADQRSLMTRFNAFDVLFGKLRPYLKKFAHPSFDGVCSSEIWALRGTRISSDFLFQMIQSSQFNQLANISTGSKMPRADWKTIADSEFEHPHLDEQQKIADFLSAIDTKTSAVADQIDAAQTLKKGLLQQMFV